VTLSGCSTGLNGIAAGDEILGLVRGLLYAGAQAVMVTLWDASDRSTAVFMAAFYRHLKSHTNKARAAQLAMQDVRAQYPHPFYWAPFVLVGQVGQP
jgi:CHAT domain-containing protein